MQDRASIAQVLREQLLAAGIDAGEIEDGTPGPREQMQPSYRDGYTPDGRPGRDPVRVRLTVLQPEVWSPQHGVRNMGRSQAGENVSRKRFDRDQLLSPALAHVQSGIDPVLLTP